MGARATLVLVDDRNPFSSSSAPRRSPPRGGRASSSTPCSRATASRSRPRPLRRLIAADAASRTSALLVMAVRDHGLSRVVREAADAGVHFVFLNATEDDLDAVRREAGPATVTVVCPDEVETGRVQGRQLRALVPAGRRVLYVQGNPRSLAARQRTAGMQEATAGRRARRRARRRRLEPGAGGADGARVAPLRGRRTAAVRPRRVPERRHGRRPSSRRSPRRPPRPRPRTSRRSR